MVIKSNIVPRARCVRWYPSPKLKNQFKSLAPSCSKASKMSTDDAIINLDLTMTYLLATANV